MIKLFKGKEKQRESPENAAGKGPVKKQTAGELRLHKVSPIYPHKAPKVKCKTKCPPKSHLHKILAQDYRGCQYRPTERANGMDYGMVVVDYKYTCKGKG